MSAETISDVHHDQRRAEQLATYDVLGRPPRRDLRALVELAAQVCDVPTAVINLITASEQVQVAAVGMDPGVCSREDSMCAAVLQESEPVFVVDASVDPRFATNPFVTGVIGDVRFYAANQLVTPEGVAIGTLCVFDDEPRILDDRQKEALRVLADRVVDVLELGLRTRQLERSLAALHEIRDELRRSNEQLGVFAGQAAHDLRNPLASVSMSLEMLADLPGVSADEDATWMVDRARSGTGRMTRMIDDLLSYGQVGGTLNRTDVDLGAVLTDVRTDLGQALQGVLLISAGLPRVYADATQLRVLLQNLVANAVKFTRPVTVPRIEVLAIRTATGWTIEVADNGPGLPPEDRERVFEPLVRATDDRVEGVGLGLAICSRVVRAHGGRIVFDEAPGGGALVRFDLPDPR